MTALASYILEQLRSSQKSKYLLSDIPQERFNEIDAFTELAQQGFITFQCHHQENTFYITSKLL